MSLYMYVKDYCGKWRNENKFPHQVELMWEELKLMIWKRFVGRWRKRCCSSFAYLNQLEKVNVMMT